MSDLTICYKVVRHPKEDSELRWSVVAEMPYEVAYLPGRRTTPMVKKTMLYVFASQKDALWYAQACRDTTSDFVEVWFTLAENAKRCEEVGACWSRGLNAGSFDHFWAAVNAGDPTASWLGVPPQGTVECEAVSLIECLERVKGTREDHRYVIETSAP